MQEQLDTPCEFVKRRPFRPIIYGLVDPLEPKHIRYVGMATNANRPYVHANLARRDGKPSHIRHWVQKLQAEGREYLVLILEELSQEVSRQFLGEVEKMYIASLREIGHSLTNATDGGDGLLNPSPEFRAALSARNKGNKYGLGKKKSEKTKLQISESRKQHYLEHPEAREEISIRNLGNTYGKAGKGKVVSAETRVLLSRIASERVVSDATRVKQRESHLRFNAAKRAAEAHLTPTQKAVARAEARLAKLKAKENNK